MTRASIALVLSLLACSDPSLKIVYAIEDAALAEEVDRVTVELYLPGGFDCDALAFGLITPTPSLQIDLQERSPELATIPRTGTKLFVLRGYGVGSEEPAIAGCAEVETIEGEEEVRIVAEPVTLATVEGGSFGLTEDRTVDFNRWQVQIQDLLSRPQPQIAVRWEAFGAGMLEPMTGQAIAAPGQELGPIIALPQAPAPGPLRMTVRARWALASSTALSFVPPLETRFSLAGMKADFAVVDSPRLLLSLVQTSTTTEVSAFHPDGDQIERSSNVIPGAWILGQTSASTFLLSGDQVRRVSAFADGSVQLAPSAPFPPGQAVEVVDLSGCDPARADPLGVAVLAGGAQQMFDGMFSPVSLPGLAEAGRIEASGCVPTRDGPEARLLWSAGESRHLSFLSEERIQTLPLDPRIVSLAFGGRWTDAANVAITTWVVDGTTQISVRPHFSPTDGLLDESPETLLGAAAAMDAADVDDNGTLDLVVVTRIDSVRHALYIIVTGHDRASAGAGLVLLDRFIDPWLAVVAFPGRAAPVIVVGDRREGRDVEERGLLFLSMEH